MSLQIAVALILAGLVVQSRAIINTTAPGFSYTSEKNDQHDRLAMSVDKGRFLIPNPMCNVSAWSFLPGNGSSTITQDLRIPYSEVVYFDVEASAGDDTIHWPSLVTTLNTTKQRLSLTAKGNQQCKLEAKFSTLEIRIHLLPQLDGEISRAFKRPEVEEELKSVLAKTLADALPAHLTVMQPRPLPSIVSDDALCRRILAATPKSFPQPNINDEHWCTAEILRNF